MPRYKRRPTYVEAIHWDGDAAKADAFIGAGNWSFYGDAGAIEVPGIMGIPDYCGVGDWLGRTADGKEFVTLDDESFRKTYDADEPIDA